MALKGSIQGLPRAALATTGHALPAPAPCRRGPRPSPTPVAALPAQISCGQKWPSQSQRRRNSRGCFTSPKDNTSSGGRAVAAPQSWVCRATAAAVAPATEERGLVDTSVNHYRCHSRDGAVVDAVVDSSDERAITVRVAVSYHNVPQRAPQQLQLHWGMFRASGAKWHHPREAVPPGSSLEPGGGGAMRTPMAWDPSAASAGPGGHGAWTVLFTVPAALAPVHLAFALYQPGVDTYDRPLRAAHFTLPVGMGAGSPEPLGASVVSVSRPASAGSSSSTDPRVAAAVTAAVNFAVFSRHASSVQLCLVRLKDGQLGRDAGPLEAQNVLEIALDPLTNRTGDVWHICVHGLKDLSTLCWAWRADGEILWQNGNRFHPGFMLLDPHASRPLPVLLPAGAHKAAPRLAPGLRPEEPVWLGGLAAFVEPPFDWQGHHVAARGGGQGRRAAAEEGVVYELDVASFTSGPDAEAQVPPEHRGKYLGILDRVETLNAIGATAVMLTPVSLSADPRVGGGSRHPLSFLAPDPTFAVGGPGAAAEQLKTVIRGLHRAGIEVILEVEFCLTSEGGDAGAGRLQGLRGLDHAVYYREGLDAPVLNCGHPVVRQLVLSALRHWAAEYRVDGFCFLNAENLTQDKFGSVLDNPPLAEEIAADPVLRGTCLIAAVSDPALLPRGGERGFPHWGVWMQVNDRFRSDLTAYLVNGQRGLLSAVATRLTGSADLFAPRWDAGLPGGLAAGRRAAFGLNAAGPLGDVSLSGALAAGGADAVRAEAAARALIVAQFMSSGQPLVPAASLSRPGIAQLEAALAAVRRGYRALISPSTAVAAPPPSDAAAAAAGGAAAGAAAEREVTWHSPYGSGEPDWAAASPDAAANVLVLTLGGGAARPGHMLAVAFNPNSEPVGITLPRAPSGACWRLLVDTARPVPTVQASGGAGGAATLGVVLPPAEQGSFTMGPYGAVLLDAVPLAAAPAAPARAQTAATGAPSGPAPPAPPPPAAVRQATPPPGYGLSPAAAAAAAAAAAKKQAPTTPYKTTGGTPSTWTGDAAGGVPPSS